MKILKFVISILAIFIFFIGCSKSENNAMCRANLENTGVYETKGVPRFNQVKWKYDTGAEFIPSPTISNGIVYFGSDNNYFCALDSQTGKEKWKLEIGGSICTSPAVSKGTVYFGSCDNNFYVLDAQTGQQKWKFETYGSIYSSPAISNGTVYFGSDYLYAIE